MFKKYIFVFTLICYSVCQNSNNGRSYYFKIGKTNNEFRVNNRIYFLNHNISDYDYTHKLTDKINREPNFSVSDFQSTRFLDEEWNFNHQSLVKTELPLFIHKIYEKSSPTNARDRTTRILFNENRNNTSSIIKFNLDSLKPNETVIDAEFYFFWPLDSTSTIYRESVVLRLYQFEKHLPDTMNASTLIENPDIHKLFNVIYISKAQKGWQIFKIKKPIDNWLNGEDNLGLLLTISSHDDNKLISVFNDTNEGVYRSFAVVTLHKNDLEPKEVNIKKPESSSFCEKKDWIVNIKKLHWDNFIIAPIEFTVSDCSGKCLSFRGDYIAHVKLLENFHKRSSCCVPVDYLPLCIMFYDKLGNIVIKSYENIIVARCGCR